MSKNVTMRDIAEKLNLSAVSVSKAISGKEGVSGEVRELILKTAAEMGYVYIKPENTKKNSYKISIMVSRTFFSDASFYAKLFQELAIEFGKKHHSCTLEILSNKDEVEGNLPINVEEQKMDGLIVMGPISNVCIKKVLHLEIPCVFVDNYTPEIDADCVVSDNMYGAHILTNYLAMKGMKRIAYVGNVAASNSIMDRYLGYYKAMMQHGINVDPDYLIDDRDDKGYLTEINLPRVLPEAFVCNCDEVAYRLIEQLRAKNIKVPDDVSVVGFDDYVFATLSNPKLTTFRVNMEEMSQTAVALMEAKLENPHESFRRKVISGEMILRDSVKE